jgi:hypothetical protein
MAEHRAGTKGKTRIGLRGLASLGALVAALALGAGNAEALQIREFDATPNLTQAGGHPDITITYSGESHGFPEIEAACQCNDPKDIIVSLPAGFIGNPHATPQCKASDFARLACPADSQVGVMAPTVDAGGGLVFELANEPVYNLVPRPDQAGLLGVSFLPGFFSIPFFTSLGARTGSDYGLNAYAKGLERYAVVQRFTMTLWGVPADDSHTPLRWISPLEYGSTTPSNSPHIPFLINPTTCTGPVSSSVSVFGYDASFNSAGDSWPVSDGCDQLTFNPSLSARPTTTATDSASGVDIELTVPQILSPTFPSPSQIKAATVTLPEGFSINPNAADGKTSCSDTAASFGTENAANCPEFAKVGTSTIDSPALPAPISGGIYIGDPQPGNRYRIFLTASGFATHVKLAGTIRPDPQTGQVVTSFTDLPQAPLTKFNMHFFGAERGLLATPTQCGTYAVHSTFTPWDEVLASQSSTQFFVLDSGPEGRPCPPATRPFNPSFSAASAGNTAGAHSPFTLDLARDDGDQYLSGLIVSTPPGFSATLAGIPYCSDGALAAAAGPGYTGVMQQISPSCPAASQIGTAVAGAGSGSRPLYLDGKVYLAGPYKGAPLSIAVITPAVSGPFDLGNVVVRVAVNVDPTDAQVTAVSDPIPQIIEGIPTRVRHIRINLDRNGFTLNPTNCDRFQVSASILGDQGTASRQASHYQVANCANMPFAPDFSLRLSGGVRRRGHPAIHAELTSRPGEANLSKISVALPKGELLDNAHIGTVCTRVAFADDACPPGSLVGQASVTTPLLDSPLTGRIYLRSSEHKLPDLALDLEGQVDIEAVARVDSLGGRLRASFESVPDVPVSRVVVDLIGGSRGLLQNSKSLCGKRRSATTSMAGQNGATYDTKTKLQVSCGSTQRRKRHNGR